MAELSTSEPRRNNRAKWIGLRTLRQVPRIVGRTTTGDSVFEVRSVRLVLPADAAHFNRMLSCSACGRDVPGPPVLTAGDLDQRAHSVICGHCTRTAEAPALAPDERRPVVERRALGHVSRNGAGNGRAPVRATPDDRLAALERRMAEVAAVASGRTDAQPADGLAGLHPRHKDLARVQDEMGGRLARLTERLAQDAEAERGRRAAFESRLQRLELTSAVAAPHQWHGAPAPAQVSPDGVPESGRLHALEQRLHDAVCRLTEALGSHRVELEDGLRRGLDEMRSTITADAAAGAGRLEVLEEHARQRELEVSELRDLQMVLDAGMGELLSGVAAIRDGNARLAGAQAELQRRLDALAGVQRAKRVEPGGRALGRRSSDAAARAAALSATVDDLAGEQQRLREQLTSLEQATGTLAAEAAKASARAAATVPLRRDVRSLHEQVAAQNEALDAVRRSVERLGRRIPARASAAKRGPRATKT